MAGAAEEGSALELGARTARMASFILISKVLSFAFLAVSFIVVARLLGPSIYGVYVVAAAVAGTFSSFGSFGVATALNKFGSEYMTKKERQKLSPLVSDGLAILFMAGVVLTLAAIALSVPIAKYSLHNTSYAYVIQVIAGSILASMLFGAGYSMLIGVGRSMHAGLVITSGAFFQAAISIGLALTGFGALAPALGLVLGQAAGFLIAIYLITNRNGIGIVAPTIAGIRRMLKFSLPVALSNMFGAVMNNISLIVLGLFATTFMLGNFGIASKVGYMFDIVFGSISLSLLPTFTATLANSKLSHRAGEFFSYSVYLAFLLAAPLIFFVAMLAKPVSYVAFSGVYTLAPLYLRITALGLLIYIAGSYASTLLISANKVKKVLKYNAILAAVQLVLLFVLVPEFKGVGLVVLMFIITPTVMGVMFVRAIMRDFRAQLHTARLARVLAANVISSIPIYLLSLFWGGNYIPLLITAAITYLLVYPPALVVVGAMSEGDMARIRHVSSRIPVVGDVMGYLLSYAGLLL
jgi:O-antigen/teichoic acid export membrane protein